MNKLILSFLLLCFMFSCKEIQDNKENVSSEPVSNQSKSLINREGKTIDSRIKLPEGFKREKYPVNSFENYLQTFPLLPDTARVVYYNGKLKNKNIHSAVLDLDVGNRDLQQCADAVIRLRAEYLFKEQRFSDIHFNFTNGFTAEYLQWAKGYRIRIEGNKARWVKSGNPDTSYSNFKNYLFYVYNYAGTISLSQELKPKQYKDLSIGDVFIQGGSPGHAMIVMDVAVNPETGRKIYLLAQSYMPAQSIHVVKNLKNTEISPWYEVDENLDRVVTPEWIFKTIDLKKF